MSRIRMHVLALALSAAVGLSAPDPEEAVAQTFDLMNTGDGPVEIEADGGIEWRQDEGLLVASGNAVARRGAIEVRADRLEALYRPRQDGGSDSGGGPVGTVQVSRLTATGNVRLTRGADQATGALALYDLDEGLMVLTGGTLRLVSGGQEITAEDSLEYWLEQRLAVARGDARLNEGGRRIRADVLSARLAEGADGQTRVARVDAFGAVRIAAGEDTISGSSGSYLPDRGIAALAGPVRLQRGQNTLSGCYAEVNMRTGVSRLFADAPPGYGGCDGQVEGAFVPERPDSGGGDGN